MKRIMFKRIESLYAFGPVTIWSSSSTVSASYARAVKLEHSGLDNGKIYATFETWTSTQTPMPCGPTFPIYESTNGGSSWSKVGDVSDYHSGEGLREQGFLFELPQTIGSMSAGTLLLAVNAFSDTETYHNIELYKSVNLGRSWSYVSTIDVGGAYGGGMNWESQGIWEPFLLVANDKLICYYADEQDDDNNQMVVHRTSSNGVDWSDTVVDVALGELRPGMPTVTKMGNDKYLLSYEIVNYENNQIHFKISSNPESWGSSSDQGTPVNYYKGEIPGSQPYVIWIPEGGPNGTVVLSTGGSAKLFLNYNYGQGHWITQDCVIPNGYSRCLVPMSNNTIFIISSVYNSSTTKYDVKCGSTDIAACNNTYNDNLFMLVNRNGKCADLIGGDTDDGARINQWSYDYSGVNQRWSVIPTGDGHFRIASKVSGKDLCVENNSLSNGAQIINSSYEEGNTSHQWDFISLGDGWFAIQNVASGKYLDVDANSLNNDAKMQQWSWTGANCQYWRLQPQGDYYIQAKHSGKYINIGGGSTSNGADIIQYSFETNNWFKWRIENVYEGWAKVTSQYAGGKCIDVLGSDTDPGTEFILYTYNGTSNQNFRIEPQNDGSFQLFARHSGLVWDIAGSSLDNCAILNQWTDGDYDCQRFYLERIN